MKYSSTQLYSHEARLTQLSDTYTLYSQAPTHNYTNLYIHKKTHIALFHTHKNKAHTITPTQNTLKHNHIQAL